MLAEWNEEEEEEKIRQNTIQYIYFMFPSEFPRMRCGTVNDVNGCYSVYSAANTLLNCVRMGMHESISQADMYMG